MDKDKMSKEAKCHKCIHFPMCSWRTNTVLIADERFKYYCGHYANEKDYCEVGEDEIVVKKSDRVNVIAEEFEELIRKETARDILQAINKYLVGTRGIYTIKTFRNGWFEDLMLVRADDLETLVKKLAEEHDVELED